MLVASGAGTALFVTSAVVAAAGAPPFPAVVIAVGLFAASIPLGIYAVARGAVRAARGGERVTVPGLFLLSGSAPAPVRRLLLGCFAASLVVSVATATADPFGILAPVYPLSLCGVWAARHGTFPPRPGGGPAPP